jgi:hypothetical protein
VAVLDWNEEIQREEISELKNGELKYVKIGSLNGFKR